MDSLLSFSSADSNFVIIRNKSARLYKFPRVSKSWFQEEEDFYFFSGGGHDPFLDDKT